MGSRLIFRPLRVRVTSEGVTPQDYPRGLTAMPVQASSQGEEANPLPRYGEA